MAEKPDIFNFTDYRAFLAAFYDYQRSQGSYSHRVFADRAGLKSRSYLRLVLAGKRNLTSQSIAKFIVGLELKPSEANAFTALVNYNQSSDFKTRKLYWEMFLRARPQRKSYLIHDMYAFFSRMAYPFLLSIIYLPDVDHSLESLSKMSGLTIKEVEEALDIFVNLRIISRDGGKFKPLVPSVETTNDVPNVALQTFHRNLLKLAQEKLDLPSDQREYQSVIVSLSKEELVFAKARLRELATELTERFSPPKAGRDKVYAMQMTIIPVTPDFIRTKPQETDASARQESDAVQIEPKEIL